ncbi:GNAT family N-acetyltransferase [Idiomarina ramblicola]|uniref:N-acetyltransferase n=1 Tax=Idiomarina ramblicola TaxID=263724 RepID=A0A432Z522_9GAMM|nr:GNAT family N-acetyltransferase [Idiomarina ramblicola]RUO72955.1 N-acetyltransferase [Idiomarina ramblicola]
MSEEKASRERVYQVSSNRERASHKLRYVEASAPIERDCRLCVGSLTASDNTESKFSIAKATYDDIARIAFLEKQLYSNKAYPALFFYQALQQWSDTFLSLKVDAKVAGYSLMVPLPDNALALMSLLLGKGFQGQGLGKELLQQSILLAQSLRYERLELSVSPENKFAVSLYEGVGFQTTDSMKDYLGPGEDRLLMSLPLAKA